MIYDELWPCGPRLAHSDAVMPLGTDAVLLADFASKKDAAKILDMGCGSGVIPILLLWKNRAAAADAFDIQPDAVRIATENAAVNGLAARLNVFQADLRTYRPASGAGGYDLVVCNPPYFPVGSGYCACTAAAASAREERLCTLADVCSAGSYFTRWGGRFTIVHRPERLSEVFCRLAGAGLEPKRLRFVQKNALSAPSLALIESRRGGKAGLSVEAPLILADASGHDSEEIRQIYHR